MKLIVNKTIDVQEVHIMLDPDGKDRIVLRYVDRYGDIVQQDEFKNINEALYFLGRKESNK